MNIKSQLFQTIKPSGYTVNFKLIASKNILVDLYNEATGSILDVTKEFMWEHCKQATLDVVLHKENIIIEINAKESADIHMTLAFLLAKLDNENISVELGD